MNDKCPLPYTQLTAIYQDILRVTKILRFIKTLGYDEDPDTKMIVVSKMVATRPHQPWKAILSVLNRNTDSDTIIYSSCLEESDSETDDVDDSDMDLSDDSSQGDDDAIGFRVSMHKNKKKRRKDVGEPHSRSSRRNKSPMVNAQDDTPAMQPLDQVAEYVHNQPNPEWFLKKSRPSIVAIAKKLKAIIQKDELTIADLEGAGLERLKQQYQNDVKLEYHVDQLKATVLSEAKWNSDEDDVYYKQGIKDMISDSWCKENHCYTFESLNGIHHWEDSKINLFKAEMINLSEGKIYSDLRIKLVVRIVVKKKWGDGFLTSIVVRRSDDNEYEFNYADLPRLSLNDVEHMYLLQLSEVKKFYDGTLMKICHNLIHMVNTNELGKGNRRWKGIDWAKKDVKKSNEMVDKID
ncbi:hypothetical protein Tco_1090054 [Tanacetum coccineum]|uniref:Uncharacterized protein n=1 Tax=Tanacetum coccineum TaxID=301880 RepID=A0ABQ5I391_9ASTR